MRIALINHGLFPFLLGGMERHTHFLATHMARLGAKMDVFVPELTAEQTAVFEASKAEYNLIQAPWGKRRVRLHSNYHYTENIIPALMGNGYDAIYCQGFNAWAYMRQVPREKQVLTILNMHGMEMFKTVGVWQTVKHLHMRLAAFDQVKRATRVISSGGRLTGETRRFLGVKDERIDVIPNGVDLDHVDALRAGAPQPNDAEPHFVFIGRLAANKGLHVLCAAFAEVPEAKVTIIGGGPLDEELRRGYPSANIRFAGPLDDKPMFDLLASSFAFVFPSLYEGMPTVVLEAMACGLPIIATDIGAVTTMVGPDNGFVVEAGSVSQLVAAIRAILALPKEKRAALGAASRRKVEQNFAWPRVARMTLDLVEKYRK